MVPQTNNSFNKSPGSQPKGSDQVPGSVPVQAAKDSFEGDSESSESEGAQDCKRGFAASAASSRQVSTN